MKNDRNPHAIIMIYGYEFEGLSIEKCPSNNAFPSSEVTLLESLLLMRQDGDELDWY